MDHPARHGEPDKQAFGIAAAGGASQVADGIPQQQDVQLVELKRGHGAAPFYGLCLVVPFFAGGAARQGAANRKAWTHAPFFLVSESFNPFISWEMMDGRRFPKAAHAPGMIVLLTADPLYRNARKTPPGEDAGTRRAIVFRARIT